mmetsp:Transcript_10677/g.10797  ORF Transcript_10677/g.10797 Transcript_10677/m.10797 type:complete len:88 (+) Transcript_10677:163-426(+)
MLKRSERSKSTEYNKENRMSAMNEDLNLRKVLGVKEENQFFSSGMKQETLGPANEDELVWSIARFLKQSQGATSNDQNLNGKSSGVN